MIIDNNISDSDLFSQLLEAFSKSFAYNGSHPLVDKLYKICDDTNRIEIYKKAYDYYYN